MFGAVRTKSAMNNGTELFHDGFALLSLKFRFVCYGVKIMRITVSLLYVLTTLSC